MEGLATTAPPAAPGAAPRPVDEHDVDRYAGLLRDLREALQEPPEFAFRVRDRPAAGSGMAA
jgi:hypothetical protein